jgi:hypothetical protein
MLDWKSTSIAPVLRSLPPIPAETFSAVIQHNIIEFRDFLYVSPLMEDYLKFAQNRMKLWRHIRYARIDFGAVFEDQRNTTEEMARNILNLWKTCPRLEAIEIYLSSEIKDILRLRVESLNQLNFMETVANLPSLQQFRICWTMGGLTTGHGKAAYGTLLDQGNRDLVPYVAAYLEAHNSKDKVCIIYKTEG